MKYVVRVTETLSHTVIVEADNMEDAEYKAEDAYCDGQIVLDYYDFDDHRTQAIREATDKDIEWFDVLEVKE